MDTVKVTQLKAVVPLELKRELFALLQLRGKTFLEWLREHMEQDVLLMRGSSGTTVKKADSELLYPIDKESVAAARQRRLSVGKAEQE